MAFKLSLVQVLVVFVFMPSSILGLRPCYFPAIFNFGDSNSDTGGHSALYGQLPPPYGITYYRPPSGRARYSDGRLMIDFMAESLGFPYLSAYLDSIGSDFTHGANFATGGSTIRPQNTTYQQTGFSPVSLDIQHVQYSDFVNRVLQQGLELQNPNGLRLKVGGEDYFARALYTVDIGQNDLTAAYDLGFTTDEVKAIVPDILLQFSNVIKLLYGEGARSFWIHNNAPMGCLTYFTKRFPEDSREFDEYGCYIPYNNVSQYFNLRLKETVLQLRNELPEASITYVDIYKAKYTLISQTAQLGFEDPILVCCSWGGGDYDPSYGCGDTRVVNGAVVYATSCKDPSVRVNWDGVHFSEAANKWVFDQIVDGSFSDPPLSLMFACNKNVDLHHAAL